MMTVPVWGKFNVEKIFTYNTSTPEGISYEELYPTLVSRWSPSGNYWSECHGSLVHSAVGVETP